MLQPKTKAADLIDRLNILSEDEIKNDILMRQLLNEAKTLAGNREAAMNDYIALGALYSLRKEPDEVFRTFDQALKKFGEDADLLANYAVSLGQLNLHPEAYSNLIKAYRHKAGDNVLLDKLLRSCLVLGRFREAHNWLEQWHRLFPDKQYEQAEIVGLCYDVVLKNNIQDEATQQLIVMTHSLLHEKGLYIYPSQLNINEDEYSNWISCEIELDLPEDKVFDLGAQLAEKFATEEVDTLASIKFVIRLVPKE